MPISISEARALYDAGAPVARVAEQLGLTLRAFRTLRQTHGWPLRAPVGRPSGAPASAAAPPSVTNVRALRRQLESRLHKEIAAVGEHLAGASDAAAERTARTFASLVKSLAELRRLEALEPSCESASGEPNERDERPPRDLDALREELARALERLSHG